VTTHPAVPAGATPGAPPGAAPPDIDLSPPPGDDVGVTTDDGARLAVRTAGAGGTAAPVVMAHGWTSSRAVWAPVARRLVAAGHPVVLYDQRGHGESTPGRDRFSVERLGDDLAAVLTALDVRGAVLAGHSMGGITVMAAAVRHPDMLRERARALALVATTAAGLGGRRRERAMHVCLRGTRATRVMRVPPVGRALTRGAFGRAPERSHVEATRTLFVATPGPVRVHAAEAMMAMDLRAGLAAVDRPTAVVLGLRDRLIANRLTRDVGRRIAGAAVVELVDAGHMLPLERPEAVAAVIVRLGTRGSGSGSGGSGS